MRVSQVCQQDYKALLWQAVLRFTPHLLHNVDFYALLLGQVVEAELQRIPRALLRGHSQELWSIVYMPQARTKVVAE